VRVYQFRHIRAEDQCSRGPGEFLTRRTYHGSVRKGLLFGLLAALLAPAPAMAAEVVVTLEQPSLSQATTFSRALTPRAKARRLDLGSPSSRGHLAEVERSQARVEAAIERALPNARVRWRYRMVLNGLAVVLAARDVPRLARVPGVGGVLEGGTFGAGLDRSAPAISAPALWGPTLTTAGQGVKIGIVDQGVDHTHPFFNPAGYAYPAGYPKGQRAFTTPKVIVARSFPPASPKVADGSKPFVGSKSEHGTHVAGIAAGNAGTLGPSGIHLAGVAPRAYIGNYRALTVPSPVGENGNAPEIARAIEAAVRDGMDVINLSIGEFEIEPSRDLVTRAIDGAANAGVVPVVSAGNDFGEFSGGSIGSPGTAAKAITVASSTNDRGLFPGGMIAPSSSAGPTPVSLRLKPDVTAPGQNVLSASPGEDWVLLSGTSMAAPHVAGAAALLRQRHPNWTVAQIKSALVQTANPVVDDLGSPREVSPIREGGGLADLVEADAPLLFAQPSGISFGLVRPGRTVRRTIRLQDAGGGAGRWSGRLVEGTRTIGELEANVPGPLAVSLRTPTAEGEHAGFVELRRGSVLRRIPYWYRVARPHLPAPRPLRGPGTYAGSTAGRRSRAAVYRYPELQNRTLRGPELVFRLQLARPAANIGVAIVRRGPGVDVEPRIVRGRHENRLAGYAALPLHVNPYLPQFGQSAPVAGVIRPAAGAYDVVFDSPSPSGAGAFRFRVWVDDRTPPAVIVPALARGGRLRVRVSDSGAGVDPRSLTSSVDGGSRQVAYGAGVATVNVSGLARGRHTLVLQVSDYQEAKNNENVLRVLPNTRRVRASFTIQ
jgi:subtilisin family serine protease